MTDLNKHSILHLLDSEFFGITERHLAGQFEHIEDFFCSCASFKRPERDNGFLREMRRLKYAAFEIEERKHNDRRIPGKIRKLLKSNGIDLLVTHDYRSNLYGYKAAKKIRVPHIAYFHDRGEEGIKARFENFLNRRIMKKLERIIVDSQFCAKKLADGGIPRNMIKIVNNAVETDLDHPWERSQNAIPVVGFAGKLNQNEGVHVLLKALSVVKKKNRDFKAEIHGASPSRGKLLKLCGRLGLNDIVCFMDSKASPSEIYGAIDFLVLPSLKEIGSLNILEAWAHGIGVIASRAYGAAELIENGKSGLLTEIGSAGDLADAILRALDDPYLMINFGKAGFVLAREKYNFNSQAERLTEIYNELLGSGNA